MIEAERLAEWVGRLVRIPSVSPTHAGPRAGRPGEGRLGEQVATWLRELGGEVHVHEVAPGRANVYGIWRGRTETWAAVDVHMDTVSVEQMTGDPFSGHVEGGRVHGRGAVDTKATLGVTLALLEDAAARGVRPVPNLLVAATVDEEDGALGAPAFAAWLRERGLVLDELAVAEATWCGPVFAHKGVLRLELTIVGEPAHTCKPHLGKNALAAGAHVVVALEAEHLRLQGDSSPGPLGPATLTVTQFHSGRGANVVPDLCTIGIDRRLIPGETGDAVAGEITEMARSASPLPVRSRTIKAIPAFWQDPEAAWVQELARWSGTAPDTVPYCTNAWAYRGVARECVVIGPGSIDQAHGVEEWVEVAELEKLARLYSRWWFGEEPG